jgi:predicted O-methyltransferase YrrM
MKTYDKSSGMGLYDLFRNNGPTVGIEIGVHEGVNATYLLEALPELKLTGVDPYTSYIDWNGLDVNYETEEFSKIENAGRAVENKFSRFKLLETTSDKAVTEFEDESVDFVFIDGLHTFEQVLKDCKNYLPKIKPGGIISGHDYEIITDVTYAADAFAILNDKEVKYLASNTTSWYWIK